MIIFFEYYNKGVIFMIPLNFTAIILLKEYEIILMKILLSEKKQKNIIEIFMNIIKLLMSYEFVG